MPGITLDTDDEGETSFVRVGGLDPKYAGFSMDGITLASATEGQTRANSFQQMSITAIESIEFNQTLLARMPANTPAGKFELKTRYAFNRKQPEISFDFGLDGTANTIEIGRAYLPDNKKHLRTWPGGRIGYGGVFLKRRLGIEASVSRYANYRSDQRHTIQYVYRIAPYIDSNGEYRDPNPGTAWVTRNGNIEALEGPSIRQIQWLDGPRIITTESANLSLDYKFSPYLTFSLRNNFNHRENEYFNVYFTMVSENHSSGDTPSYTGPYPGVHPTSSLTFWKVEPGDPRSLESEIHEGNSYRVSRQTDYLISPRFNYKKGPLEINLRGGYSYSFNRQSDGDQGRFRGAPNRLSGAGWEATRSSTDSPTWDLRQVSGDPWTESQNWGRSNTYLMGVYYDDPHTVKNTQLSGYLDLTYAMRVFNHPVTFRAGGSVLDSDFARRRTQKNFNFLDAYGLQMMSLMPYADKYVFNPDLGGKAGNIARQSWPVINQDKLWSIFEAHPEWFLVDAVDNTRNALVNQSDLAERIDALYTEATTRFGKFQLNLGVRFERTSTEVQYTDMKSTQQLQWEKDHATPEEIATGKFDTGTIEGVRNQYNYGERKTRGNNYDNLFLSGGLKYDFTANLRLQLSMSQAILRPDYGNLAGVVNYPDYYPTNLWIPNPKLAPEKTTKYYAGLQYYLNPAGLLEISAYRLDINGLQIRNMQISAAQAETQLGYSINDVLGQLIDNTEEVIDEETQEAITTYLNQNPITYRSTVNAPGNRIVYGITLRYDQQLTFLPGILKGLSIDSSFTTASLKNAELDEEKIGRSSKIAKLGIKYRLGRFSVRVSGSWEDDRLYSITRPLDGRNWVTNDRIYYKDRLYMDLSGNFRLNKNLELVWSVRNLTSSPIIRYSNVPGRLVWYSVPDTIWNFSIRGKY
jgi:TonB-dependent receptor